MNQNTTFLETDDMLRHYAALSEECSQIDNELYTKYDVKKGLRDLNGKGVLAGLTNISTVTACKEVNGERIPCDGELLYRGVDVKDLVAGGVRENRRCFEEAAYLLLFGTLPSRDELDEFCALLADLRTLPRNFVRDVVMKAPSHDIMNSLSKSVLMLASYDDRADDLSSENVLRQCLRLISVMPQLAVYGYHSYNHYLRGRSFYIHNPRDELSEADNLLRMLRSDKQYSELEASVLDLCMLLHMEHGGGNNSTFTTRVVTSSGSDTYSVFAAALGSLKGPKHGGANIKVVRMFQDMKEHVHDFDDEDEICDYLRRLLHKQAFDKQGLIYGMGHAVYSISDPRAQILKKFTGRLSAEKGLDADFRLLQNVEKLAPKVIAEERHIYKGVSANVDFYSGFVYSMLGIPVELYTPIFALARVVGWSAHRMEELFGRGKIIRPAYRSISEHQDYISMDER